MTERRKINILIDGRNFTVVGSDNEDYVRSLANYVDKKIKDLASKNDRLCQTSSATLAALNIADELYHTKERLQQLENKAKDPMQKYSNLISELDKAKDIIQNLELQCSQYKDDLLKTKIENENVMKEMKKNEQALELKEKELVESQKMIKSLQDKIFDNQMELIEVKKELGEVIRRLDSEKNIFVKEEV
ncbi:cell division protein ZapA [Tissierella praeacuta]|uniref:cell division protein ZapA n=1 Tax=Tissierella praeacuta TaxID=43131 RepID=UPI0028A646EB|nr:cell division protein ZapA [Tissierella praeacuta]